MRIRHAFPVIDTINDSDQGTVSKVRPDLVAEISHQLAFVVFAPGAQGVTGVWGRLPQVGARPCLLPLPVAAHDLSRRPT